MFIGKIKSAAAAVILMATALTVNVASGIGRSYTAALATELAEDRPGERLYREADWIFNHATTVHYQHNRSHIKNEVVENGDTCISDNDCSGFVTYVIRKVAARHLEIIDEDRKGCPHASRYAHFFASLANNDSRGGWIGVSNFHDLHTGDVIAWAKENPDGGRVKGNTGHVMIVADAPAQTQTTMLDSRPIRYVSVRVIDSSSVDHFPPEMLPPNAHQQHRDGLGKGSIRLVLDDQDRAIGYWEGTYWNEGHKPIERPSYSSDVAFGRLVPLTD